MTPNTVRRATARLAPALVLALVVAACGGGSVGVKVTDAWARNSSMAASAGAAYMVIENVGSASDALIGASSTVAKTTEVHETVEMPAESAKPMESPAASGGMGSGGMASPAASGGMGSGGMASPAASGGMGSGGMLGMQPVDRVEIPAGGTLELKPGSYHIMLIGLNQDLKVGDTIEITLKLEKAGDVKVTAVVRAN